MLRRHPKISIVLLILFLSPAPVLAKYRAYELAITQESTGTVRTVISTLDDIQYGGYHRLNPGELVQIRSTWMCWSRTDQFKPICANPAGAPAAGPTTNSGAAGPPTPTTP
ncbi:MAG: hypothetical protein NDI61_05860 [Bdellovibrionaceae bacterium]|nr:hypothetical protein [Pseudobdellovibrionaceae bacterium]